jgi:hypothetical protein
MEGLELCMALHPSQAAKISQQGEAKQGLDVQIPRVQPYLPCAQITIGCSRTAPEAEELMQLGYKTPLGGNKASLR